METIFEYTHTYSRMDEDYENTIIIKKDGDLTVRHMQTYCYEPTTIEKVKFSKESFAADIQTIIQEYKDKLDEIPDVPWSGHYTPFKLKIGNKFFGNYNGINNPVVSEITGKIIHKIKETYPKVIEDKWEV